MPEGRPPLERYRLVSFDLDGTLVDTAGEIVEACNRALADFDVPPQPHDAVVASIGHGTRELVQRQLAQVLLARPQLAGRLDFDRVYERFHHHYALTSGTTGLPYPGCRQSLVQLRSDGVVLVCVTNKETQFARQVLERTGLASFFPMLIGGDSFAFKKPDRRVIDHVLAAHRVPARLAGHVGDSAIDVQTARNAGVAAWAVPYGYNGGQPVADCGPDRLWPDLKTLSDALVSGALRPQPLPMALAGADD